MSLIKEYQDLGYKIEGRYGNCKQSIVLENTLINMKDSRFNKKIAKHHHHISSIVNDMEKVPSRTKRAIKSYLSSKNKNFLRDEPNKLSKSDNELYAKELCIQLMYKICVNKIKNLDK